ncbi:DUF5983 family protein [Sphingobium xenophagum]|uniref:DUF5983 domain-containing protein n=1 Tax=Sphingobium xenophagum TaxID=121428 RepID=A0A401J8C9_SPHXE|nr:hypothetical protein [Sphingobium xenophagum]GBH32844.1 hypothetical protein MBESOW_P4075 [Sphingobium xenophagum]
MRRFPVCACSTAHLPRAEHDAIDLLIRHAPRRSGRIIVDHPILTIEAHQYGFWVHLGFMDDWPERPDRLSPEFWALLADARKAGANWLSFDRDEPPSDRFPVFAAVQGEATGDAGESVNAATPAGKITIRCSACGSAEVMRDAWIPGGVTCGEIIAAIYDLLEGTPFAPYAAQIVDAVLTRSTAFARAPSMH